MTRRHVHTSDKRVAQEYWINLGGMIVPVRRTGEVRYLHPEFPRSIRANDRRSDVPAIIVCRINQLMKSSHS